MGTIELLNPRAEVKAKAAPEAKKMQSLKNQKVGIFTSYAHWIGFDHFAGAIGRLLEEKYGAECVWYASAVSTSGGHSDPLYETDREKYFDKVTEEISGAIVGAAF